MKSYSLIYTFIIALANLLTGCSKEIKIEVPSTQLPAIEVFSNNSTATASILNVYIEMAKLETFIIPQVTGFLSDELESYETFPPNLELYNNSIRTDNSAVQSIWDRGYYFIYNANAILEGLSQSQGVSENIKAYLSGEALFIRAFWNFYLTNLFGEIPLITSTDYRKNTSVVRSQVDTIYAHVITDLESALELCSQEYLDGTNNPSSEKVRPNKDAVAALLSRVHLYQGNYSMAFNISNSIIESGKYVLPNYNEAFLRNSQEAIWQLMPVNSSYSTLEGSQFIALYTPSFGIPKKFVEEFENGDARKLNWINVLTENDQNYYFPFKYKIKSITPGDPFEEYSMVLRVAELYLIRAECRLFLNDLDGALEDLNLLRNRSLLAALPSTLAKNEIANAIEHERRSELFLEWGHRWFDLKRLGKASSVLSSLKPSWNPGDELLPIPQLEISNNPLLTQNDNY